MLKRHKHSWSHNELFAHKKNAGEQAKLRDTVFRIEKKFGMVKDSIRQEATQVRTSLKCLRKSTGHSIDALPPTPFQLSNLRGDTFVTVVDPTSDTFRSKTNPEFDYIFDELEEQVNNATNAKAEDHISKTVNCDTGGTRFHDIEGNYSDSKASWGDSTHKTESFITIGKDRDGPTPSESDGDAMTGISKTLLLPQLEVDRPVINARQGIELGIQRNTDNGACAKTHFHIHDHSANLSLNDNNSHLDNGRLLAEESDKSQQLSLNSKENTTLTRSTGRELPNDFWSPLSSIPNHSYSNINNRSKNTLFQQRKETQRVGKRTSPNEKDNASQMRDTRTRCRTCLERYRQNLEFQRQKKLLEQEQQNQNNRKAGSKNMQPLNCGVDRPFLVTDGDLSSLFADSEVLDFEDTVIPSARRGRSKNSNEPKRGYSKARLQQLAEPRKGRRKKLLFAKNLIKKEVDDMTERHSQPLLTEREKERIRILESKIRMFLAVTSASGDVMPTSMVHIPQREDIMTVDISHL